MTELVHYSLQPLKKIRTVPLQQQHVTFKPSGLWVSVEGEYDWKTWCMDNSFNLNRFEFKSYIKLKTNSKILKIDTLKGMDDFTREYIKKTSYKVDMINWKSVAEKWQGIVISPYQWSKKLDNKTFWYCIWDCASGCVWDADAIESVDCKKEKSNGI